MHVATLKKSSTLKVVLVGALVAVALAVLLVLTLVAAERPAEAAFPGENGRIAYVSKTWLGPSVGSEDGEIYTIGPEGTDPRQLTDNAHSGENPVFSPDGARIAFESLRKYRGMVNQDVYITSDPTGKTVNLTRSRLINESYPAWSPDGTKIAFAASGGDIWVINSDGTGRINLTDDPAHDTMPAWSPDGSRIAFVRVDPEGEWEIFVMNADGSGQEQLTYSPRFCHNYEPDWSPDGTRLAVTFQCAGTFNVYTVNVGGSGVEQLTTGGALDPAWSPDGTKIAFKRAQEGYYDLFSMNVDGTNVQNLTNTPGVDEETPSWGRGS
jgi:tol-pal system beta propeller repeat protein TolB